MLVEVIISEVITIKVLDNSPLPEPGKYTIWFEKVEPDPVPEFNQ